MLRRPDVAKYKSQAALEKPDKCWARYNPESECLSCFVCNKQNRCRWPRHNNKLAFSTLVYSESLTKNTFQNHAASYDGDHQVNLRHMWRSMTETTHQVVLAKKQRVLERHDHQEEVVAPFGAQMPGGPPCTPLQDEDMPALDTNDILEEMEEMDEEDGGLDTSGILEEPPDSVKLKTDKFKRKAKKIAKKEPGED